jgi:hypothetical protein
LCDVEEQINILIIRMRNKNINKSVSFPFIYFCRISHNVSS